MDADSLIQVLVIVTVIVIFLAIAKLIIKEMIRNHEISKGDIREYIKQDNVIAIMKRYWQDYPSEK